MAARSQRLRESAADHRPDLPYLPIPLSNGEFVPAAPSVRERAILRRVVEECGEIARRRGMDRRRFLTTTGAMAATLGVLNACSSSDRELAGPTARRSSPAATTTPTASAPSPTAPPTPTPSSPPPTAPGGSYTVPDPTDEAACEALLGDRGEFVFDIHTHHVMPDGPWRQEAPGIEAMVTRLADPGCTAADRVACLDRDSYVRDMFLASDTTVALLSDVPNGGDGDAALPFADKLATADLVDSLTEGGAARLLIHDIAVPNFGSLEASLDLMAERVASGRVAAVKVYTAWGPGGIGWSLEDDTVGQPFVERLLETGVGILCAHKGLPIAGFDERYNTPDDLIAVAAAHPQLQVVIFHSAFELQTTEQAYDPAASRRGIDAVLRALDRYEIGPNANIWCDLGTTWRETMRDPNQAAHVVGKLLARVGEDRVLWGTDAIWYGSPQPQIMAFRSFAISAEFRERYGYPELTAARKAKVLGLNAAALFGLDPAAARCALNGDQIRLARAEHRALVEEGALPSPYRPRGPVTRREVLAGLRQNPRLLQLP